MPKYRRVSFARLPLIDISLKAKSLDGSKRYALQASNLDRDNFKEILPPNSWEKIQINRHCYLIFGVSKTQTGFTEEGELVCMLCFDDGRKLRLKYADLNQKDALKIISVIFDKFAPEGIKERVNRSRFRSRKRARSTKR